MHATWVKIMIRPLTMNLVMLVSFFNEEMGSFFVKSSTRFNLDEKGQ